RAADAVHHAGTADVGGVDVTVDVELQRGIDADDAQPAHQLRMVGHFLRAQHQLVPVPVQIAEHPLVAAAGQGDGAARGELHLAGIDEFEGAVLQHLRVHHQILEGGVDQDRKSTRLNSSHVKISYAVFCLKK